MGLISTEVETILKSNTISYYENLGYKIPRRKNKSGKYTVPNGTSIKVDVKDLSHGSNVIVDVKCDGDNCGKICSVRYCHYINCNRNGLFYCQNCAKKLNSGKNHYKWDDTKTDEERIIKRSYPEYTNFVKQVLARDNFTCVCCGQMHGNLNVHHLNGYHWFKEGRTDECNAVTLCETCHLNFHHKYGNEYNTKEQFEEWIGYTINFINKYNLPLQVSRKIYCVEEDKVYDGALMIEKEWNVPHTNIYSVCNEKSYVVKGKHLIWYDKYLQMSKEDIENHIKKCIPKNYKKVVCVTTKKIFKTAVDGRRFYNCSSHIIACCKNQRNYCGILEDGTKLQWMYYEDYVKLYPDKLNELDEE